MALLVAIKKGQIILPNHKSSKTGLEFDFPTAKSTERKNWLCRIAQRVVGDAYVSIPALKLQKGRDYQKISRITKHLDKEEYDKAGGNLHFYGVEEVVESMEPLHELPMRKEVVTMAPIIVDHWKKEGIICFIKRAKTQLIQGNRENEVFLPNTALRVIGVSEHAIFAETFGIYLGHEVETKN